MSNIPDGLRIRGKTVDAVYDAELKCWEFQLRPIKIGLSFMQDVTFTTTILFFRQFSEMEDMRRKIIKLEQEQG